MACTARDAPPPLPPAAGRGGLPENPRPKLCAAAAQPEALHRPGQEPPPTAGWSLPALRPSAPLRAARARTRRGSTGSTASAPSPHSQAAHPLRPRPRDAVMCGPMPGAAAAILWP
uniref:atherin-like isoform X1 n=1 Tax=Callithrix jacchus TaxID=9483 RepID=UPI00159D03CB|nr:atherin-like isoform X1 [Callithrix jacchus]